MPPLDFGPGGGSGGGGGSTAGAAYLRPGALPTPILSNVGQTRSGPDGTLFRIKRRNDGGVLAVNWQSYGNGADISSLYGEPDDTYRFRGEHDSSQVIRDILHGDVYSTSAGAFWKYQNADPTQATGWFHFAAPRNWLGISSNEADADHRATAVDQTTIYSRNIRRVSSFSHVGGTPVAFWEALRDLYENPVAYWWGKNQTEREPSGYPNTDFGNELRRIRHESAEPNESFHGGADRFGDIWVAASQISSDIDAGLPANPQYAVFSLPIARYKITSVLSVDLTYAVAGSPNSYSLRKIQANDDDVLVGNAHAYVIGGTGTPVNLVTQITRQGEDIGAVNLRISIDELVVTGPSDQYYFAGADLRENADNEQLHTRSFIRIEALF